MRVRMSAKVVMALAVWAMVPPASGWAQAGLGAIAGQVQDTTGAVLPGVGVEAASPALIEQVRAVVTDASGQYQIVALPPGVYTVTFSLPGFATVQQEEIELTTGFTANINADMRVGAVEETVTVTAASPVVDVQNVRTQRVMTREIIDLIPTGKEYGNLAILIPGMTVGAARDFGGSRRDTLPSLAIHGSRRGDQSLQVDGMPMTASYSSSSLRMSFPDSNIEETTLEYSAMTAESESGGVRVNMITQSGSNLFAGRVFADFTNASLQNNNYDDALKAAGLAAPLGNVRVWEVNPSFGGPIARDRLWFFMGYRRMQLDKESGFLADKISDDWVYTPDTSKEQVIKDYPDRALSGRITWRASERHTVTGNYTDTDRCLCKWILARNAFGGINTPDASLVVRIPFKLSQATWTAPMTTRLLFEAGGFFLREGLNYDPRETSIGPPATELTTRYKLRAASAVVPWPQNATADNYYVRASMSYVTGTHSFKIGMTRLQQHVDNNWYHLSAGLTGDGTKCEACRNTPGVGDYHVRLRNGLPSEIEYYPTPYSTEAHYVKGGLFVQDQWNIDRLAINAGVRYDWLNTSYPAITYPELRYLPERSFPAANVLSWRDLGPRLGFAYDLFGDGRTAFKASAGRYVVQEANSITQNESPAAAANRSLIRSWDDANGDFIPQGDPTISAANGEIGPSPNENFGKSILTQRLDPGFAEGMNVRQYNWEFSTSVQHELVTGVSVGGGYFRRIYGNFRIFDNLAVSPSDYDGYSITGPADSRLPGGGNEQISDLYDLNPSKVGQVDRILTLSSDYGAQTEHWNGVDFNISARLPNGALLQGGTSTGRTTTDNCAVVTKVDNPSKRFCSTESPFLTEVKFLASYIMPFMWDVQVAATYQDTPTEQITAAHSVFNDAIEPSLGRPLSTGSSVRVGLVRPLSLYGDRLRSVDLRFARTFTAGGTRLRGIVDLYNISNANSVVRYSNAFGSAWQRPLDIFPGRFVKFGVQVDF